MVEVKLEAAKLSQATLSMEHEKLIRMHARQRVARTLLVYTLLTLGAVTMLAPFLWMVTTSLKEPGALFSYDRVWWQDWVPTQFVWENYLRALEAVPFVRFYLNSIFVTFCVTLGQVATSAMAGYAFARLKFPGRDKIFFGYLATMMVPGAVTSPSFLEVVEFGLELLTPVYRLSQYLKFPAIYQIQHSWAP